MKRLNPDTGEPFKMGELSETGDRIFRSWVNFDNVDKAGYYYEIWETPETFLKRKTARAKTSKERLTTVLGKAESMINNSKNSAKKRGHTHTLTKEDLIPALEKGVCELTGIPFSFQPALDKKHMNLYSPSADRLDNNKGYHKDNIRVVLWAVNRAVGEDGDEAMLPILKEMVKAIEKNAKQNTAAPVSEGSYIQGAVGAELGSVSTPWTWEDDDHTDHHSGTVRGEDLDHRAQASSGDSVGRGGKEVAAPQAPQSVQDNGEPDAEIVRLEFGRRYLLDKP
jgi:hypothetical protein